MKFFRLDLLTLLISLFILNSCKNHDGIGLGLDSPQVNGALIDTTTILVNTVAEKPVITVGLTKTPMGYFIDPAFGTTEADMAMTLNLPGSSAYTVPSGTLTIDSAVLVLRYADGFYGDSLTSKYQINVYQLQTKLNSQLPYYNNTDLGNYSGSTPLGSRSFYSRTHDSVKITSIITGQPDSIVRVPAQLRVKLNSSFINNILFNASLAQLGSNVIFQNNVRGLYLSLDKSQTTGAGGIFMFAADSSSLNVYYKTVSSSAVIDTAMVTLPLSTHAAQIKRQLSAQVQTELNDSTSSRDVMYLQGLAGTRAKISFPYLKNILKNAGSNIVINRAELVVTPLPGSAVPVYLKPTPKLTLYRYDIARTAQLLPDASSADARSTGLVPFGGFYSIGINSYHFIVTAYIQDLISGKSIDYGTYLAPVDTTNTTSVDIAPTAQVAGRVVAVGSPSKTSPNYPYRIKLNIIYTKTK